MPGPKNTPSASLQPAASNSAVQVSPPIQQTYCGFPHKTFAASESNTPFVSFQMVPGVLSQIHFGSPEGGFGLLQQVPISRQRS